MIDSMQLRSSADGVFKALAAPTCRARFEHLARDGKQAVHALTHRAGVEQAYQGAKAGWQPFFARLEQVVAELD